MHIPKLQAPSLIDTSAVAKPETRAPDVTAPSPSAPRIALPSRAAAHAVGGDVPLTAPTTRPSGMPPMLRVRSEAIDSVNDPNRFGVPLEVRLDKLPTSGEAKTRPWAESYWPTFQNGIVARWQSTGDFKNDLSPAEKYDAAFNGWDPNDVKGLKPFRAEPGHFNDPFDASYYDKLGPLAKYLSQEEGNLETRQAAKAKKLRDDGTAKSGKKEEDYGGVADWEGLCHAWSAAAIREKEPLKPAVYNGIRFEVSDIKALLIAAYNSSHSKHIGLRDDSEKLAAGRAPDADARDVNPGSLHVILANMLGLKGEAFVEDRTAHAEVWNQPVAAFRVHSQTEITEAQAAKLVGDDDPAYDYAPKGTRFVHVKADVDYITESHPSTKPNAQGTAQVATDAYEYLLELNKKGEIVGGEWLGSSRKNHPDFLWHVYKDGGEPLAPQLDLEKVRTLLALSRGDAPQKVSLQEDISLKRNSVKTFAPIQVTQDGVLDFKLSGKGDIDVFAAVGRKPQIASNGAVIDADLVMDQKSSNEKGELAVKKGDVVYAIAFGAAKKSSGRLQVEER